MHLAPVVQEVDSAINWVNDYAADKSQEKPVALSTG